MPIWFWLWAHDRAEDLWHWIWKKKLEPEFLKGMVKIAKDHHNTTYAYQYKNSKTGLLTDPSPFIPFEEEKQSDQSHD